MWSDMCVFAYYYWNVVDFYEARQAQTTNTTHNTRTNSNEMKRTPHYELRKYLFTVLLDSCEIPSHSLSNDDAEFYAFFCFTCILSLCCFALFLSFCSWYLLAFCMLFFVCPTTFEFLVGRTLRILFFLSNFFLLTFYFLFFWLLSLARFSLCFLHCTTQHNFRATPRKSRLYVFPDLLFFSTLFFSCECECAEAASSHPRFPRIFLFLFSR